MSTARAGIILLAYLGRTTLATSIVHGLKRRRGRKLQYSDHGCDFPTGYL